MGTWGTGLYQSDTAKDLKADLIEWLGVPITPAEIVDGLRTANRITDPPVEADDCAFWLVLADQFHRFGIAEAEVTRQALAVIDQGLDITAQAELGLGEADQVKRRDVLATLKQKWAEPAVKPSKRKILKPEPQLLKAGEIFAYPTMDGNPRIEPLGQRAIETYVFEADATNAFVVLAEARYFHDLFARAFIAPLAMFRENGAVAFEDCLEAMFLCEVSYSYKTFKPVGGWTAIGARDLKRTAAEKIGQVEVDRTAAEGLFGDALTPPPSRWQTDLNPLMINLDFRSSIARGSTWWDGGDLRSITAPGRT